MRLVTERTEQSKKKAIASIAQCRAARVGALESRNTDMRAWRAAIRPKQSGVAKLKKIIMRYDAQQLGGGGGKAGIEAGLCVLIAVR
jgi:hypothetical protein